MQNAEKHYKSMAEGIDLMREMAAVMVAGLVVDGFTEEQARVITTGMFASITAETKPEGGDTNG